jgi:hypothetical protein
MTVLAFKAEAGPVYQRRLELEFEQHTDRRLVAIMLELADFMLLTYQRTLTITCLNRSIPENAAVGGGEHSAHLFGRAADIRLHDLPEFLGRAMTAHLKALWADDFLYVLEHGQDDNRHLHLNITYKYAKTNGTVA